MPLLNLAAVMGNVPNFRFIFGQGSLHFALTEWIGSLKREPKAGSLCRLQDNLWEGSLLRYSAGHTITGAIPTQKLTKLVRSFGADHA
jgi:hypothetical protein